ncbi:MAG: hypothetical protein KJZ64_05350 [Sphingomonadaceae bacterium]|nr:hypothetical protein [Sphingomonadaceae bacterium]
MAREADADTDADETVPVVEVEPKTAAPAAPAQEALPETTADNQALAEAPLPAPAPVPVPVSDTAGTAVIASASASATGTLAAIDGGQSYADFGSYALEQARLDPVSSPRRSAILAQPGSLKPETTECGILPPAVIVDLDPAGGKLDPASPLPFNPALATALGTLRASDVAVFWISGNGAATAGQLRDQLVATGLDPLGRDILLLMRRGTDRKDARRRELAETHCVVAIAGDTRSDFDELFDFLRNPGAAAPLEPLVGAGWFLIPSPTAAKED